MGLLEGLLPFFEEEERRKRMLQMGAKPSDDVDGPPMPPLPVGKSPGVSNLPPQDPGILVPSAPGQPSDYSAPEEPPIVNTPRLSPTIPPGAPPATRTSREGMIMPGLEKGSSGPSEQEYWQYHSHEARHQFPKEKHKGWKEGFKHALKGLGVGALAGVQGAYAGGARDWQDLLGGAIGGGGVGGVAGGIKPVLADRLYDEMILRPGMDKQAQREMVARKIKMEMEKDRLGIRKTEIDIQKGEIDIGQAGDKLQIEKDRAQAALEQAEAAKTRAARETTRKFGSVGKGGRIYNWETGEAEDVEEGDVEDDEDALALGSTGRSRLRDQIKNQLLGQRDLHDITRKSMAGDPGGMERVLADSVGWDEARRILADRKELNDPNGRLNRELKSLSTKPSAEKRITYVAQMAKAAEAALFKEKYEGTLKNFEAEIEAAVDAYLADRATKKGKKGLGAQGPPVGTYGGYFGGTKP